MLGLDSSTRRSMRARWKRAIPKQDNWSDESGTLMTNVRSMQRLLTLRCSHHGKHPWAVETTDQSSCATDTWRKTDGSMYDAMTSLSISRAGNTYPSVNRQGRGALQTETQCPWWSAEFNACSIHQGDKVSESQNVPKSPSETANRRQFTIQKKSPRSA